MSSYELPQARLISYDLSRSRPISPCRAEELAALQEDVELPLTLKSGGAVDGFVIQLMGVGFGYPGSSAPLFRGAELSIDTTSRIVRSSASRTSHAPPSAAFVDPFRILR